jgi:phosphoenolpyruvate carboxykinase (GTP)
MTAMNVQNSAAASAPAATVKGHLPPNWHVRQWLAECIELCQPDRVRVLDGSPAEHQDLLSQAVTEGALLPLNQEKLPGCYLHRSHPNDVARTEQCTYICTRSENLAGPTNNWLPPKEAYQRLGTLFAGCMKGRTMYVVPFVMGPLGSPLARVGVELTDSIYVAVNMGIMTRMGAQTWKQLGDGPDFTRCLHSLGDLDPARRNICHFPEDNVIWSIGSGYGGNALLGKKCLALRLASYQGFQQGWMAEHMMLMGVTDPLGETTYIAGAFPSSCGKTNFAMLIPPEKYREAGWKITTVGDDIVWMHVKSSDGRVYAINPEAGYFGVVPGTNARTNANAMAIMARDTIYTNVALLPDGDVWWEGKTKEPPKECLDWTGKPWTSGCGRPAAHPNSRFTSPMTNNPVLDPHVNDPEGVPISGIVFGGRRSKGIPLVYQAFNWIHGVYIGATLGSETTAAATGQVGVVRRDPMAMLPFCGYNINLYVTHWIRMRKKMTDCPRIFQVNWFRTDDQGHFLWPGFAENMRILEWIINRCNGRAYAAETLLGWMPRPEHIDLAGLDITLEQFAKVQAIDADTLKREILTHEELFLKLAGELPKELIFQRELLIARL